MKRKKCFIIVIIAVMLVLISEVLGTKKVVELMQAPQQERQIEFLKKHEKEMTTYVKSSEGKEVTKVEYMWQTVKVGQGMAFSKKGLTIKVNIFDKSGNKLNGFWLNIFVDDVSHPRIIENIN